MALKIRTSNPNDLLYKIKLGIYEKHIRTWTYTTHNTNQEYFSHVTSDSQWLGVAWLLPRIEADLLIFNIIKPQNANVSSAAYAIYHGRFTEMLLAHFDNQFSIVWATAMPADGDMT